MTVVTCTDIKAMLTLNKGIWHLAVVTRIQKGPTGGKIINAAILGNAPPFV